MMNKLCLLAIACLFWAGCKSNAPEESFTKGTARIGASDAVFDVARYVGDQYNEIYPQANVGFFRHPTLALIDSLLRRRYEEVFLDRALSPEESLAFGQQQLKLYSYPVAHYPTYLLVPDCLHVADLDSVGLKRLLEGTAHSWKDFGGQDVPVTVYAPLPGEGAWNSLVNYFGDLDSVAAIICSTNVRMLELAAGDPGSLLIYSQKVADAAGFKKLRWARGELRVPANAKTILETPRWPFMTTFSYVTTQMKGDVAAGYLTFIVSNDGQKMVMKEGYRPASVPVRVVQLQASAEESADSTEDHNNE
ncbi:MAG: hypothetical protein IPG71_06260 [bacterium]|nr:hypothetical protein [bacterium]